MLEKEGHKFAPAMALNKFFLRYDIQQWRNANKKTELGQEISR